MVCLRQFDLLRDGSLYDEEFICCMRNGNERNIIAPCHISSHNELMLILNNYAGAYVMDIDRECEVRNDALLICFGLRKYKIKDIRVEKPNRVELRKVNGGLISFGG